MNQPSKDKAIRKIAVKLAMKIIDASSWEEDEEADFFEALPDRAVALAKQIVNATPAADERKWDQ